MMKNKSRKTDGIHSNQTEDSDSSPSAALKKFRIVVRAAQKHSTWIEKQCGVSGAQLWLMEELREVPRLRIGEIAAKMAIHQTTVSNLVDALVKQGYVMKVRDTVDQRVVKVTLSKDGAALLAKAPKPARGLLPEILQRMDKKNLSTLNRGLQVLVDMIGEEEIFGLQPLPFTM